MDPPHEIFDFAGTPVEGEPWFPLPQVYALQL